MSAAVTEPLKSRAFTPSQQRGTHSPTVCFLFKRLRQTHIQMRICITDYMMEMHRDEILLLAHFVIDIFLSLTRVSSRFCEA